MAHPLVTDFETALQAGRAFHGKHPERWETELGMARPEDVATIVYTSGRTGAPKGALLTHSNLMFQMQALGQLCPSQPGDDQLGFLSMGAALGATSPSTVRWITTSSCIWAKACPRCSKICARYRLTL